MRHVKFSLIREMTTQKELKYIHKHVRTKKPSKRIFVTTEIAKAIQTSEVG